MGSWGIRGWGFHTGKERGMDDYEALITREYGEELAYEEWKHQYPKHVCPGCSMPTDYDWCEDCANE